MNNPDKIVIIAKLHQSVMRKRNQISLLLNHEQCYPLPCPLRANKVRVLARNAATMASYALDIMKRYN